MSTLWPRDALPEGTVINGYRIAAVVGRGAFGITYRATDAIDQVFAVKEYFPKQFAVRDGAEVLPSDHESTEPFDECLNRFGSEARALRQLAAIGAAGDGVVKVATYFQANGTAYVIMEFLAGDSLDRVLKSQKSGIPSAQLDFIVPRLLHAVACVHSAGLLHRDIKPANIMLREDGRPVLIDFGAARTNSHGRTVTFTQIFSEGYAPIEQFSGTRQGPFSDIYALGVTLYRAIGGVAVDSFTRHQALLRGKRDPQPLAALIGANRYDPCLLAAIDAAMVVAPEERPQSVAELLAFLQDKGSPDPTVVASAPPPRPASNASVGEQRSFGQANKDPYKTPRSGTVPPGGGPRGGWRVVTRSLALGKLIGGAMGFFVAGPYGAVIGTALGHAADAGSIQSINLLRHDAARLGLVVSLGLAAAGVVGGAIYLINRVHTLPTSSPGQTTAVAPPQVAIMPGQSDSGATVPQAASAGSVDTAVISKRPEIQGLTATKKPVLSTTPPQQSPVPSALPAEAASPANVVAPASPSPSTVFVAVPQRTDFVSQQTVEEQELAAWPAVVRATTPGPLERFLMRFPNGMYADVAKAKLAEMKGR